MAAADGAPGLPPEVAALNDAQLRTFREAFAAFDAANDGVIARTGETVANDVRRRAAGQPC